MVIIDSQSVKNTDTAKEKGYDAGKKISGIKRHIAVDTQGFPHAIGITTADITDRNGAIIIFENYKENLKKVEKVLADGGYTGENFKNKVKEILNAEVEIVKRNELHKFEVLPKRWIVERCFAWLEKNRRLWKNCERLILSSIGMICLGFIRILIKRI
jgi:transposase